MAYGVKTSICDPLIRLLVNLKGVTTSGVRKGGLGSPPPPTNVDYSGEMGHSGEIGRSRGKKDLGEIRGKKLQ